MSKCRQTLHYLSFTQNYMWNVEFRAGRVGSDIKASGLKTWITWSQTKSIACIFTFNHLADAFIQSDVQMRRTIEAIRPSREQQYTSAMTSLSYAKFTLHDFSPIFHSPTGFDKSPTNARDRRQLGARSREWQSRSVIIKDTIWGNPRHVADAREIFGMLNIWSCRRFSSLLCEWVLTCSDWKIHRRWPTANERARYRAAGSSRREFFFFF